MPNKQRKRDVDLIEWFLSAYEEGSWAGDLSKKRWLDAEIDNAVEIIATRRRDCLRLAIEHTRIEPFVSDAVDYHSHFKILAERLKADASLREPEFVLLLEFPLAALPNDTNKGRITDDVVAWVRTMRGSFPSRRTILRCTCPSHPAGELMVPVEAPRPAGGLASPRARRDEEWRGADFPLSPELLGVLRTQREATTALERELGAVIPWVFHVGGVPIHYRRLARAWGPSRLRVSPGA